MKPKQALALAARVLVGCVLIFAGGSKAAAPTEEFAFALAAYDVLPRDMVMTMAAFLPWIELFLGWALLLGARGKAAAAGCAALFASFLFALGSTVIRGLELPSCGCFGGGIRLTPLQTMAVDAVLLCLCWVAWKEGPGPASLDAWAERGQNG